MSREEQERRNGRPSSSAKSVGTASTDASSPRARQVSLPDLDELNIKRVEDKEAATDKIDERMRKLNKEVLQLNQEMQDLMDRRQKI